MLSRNHPDRIQITFDDRQLTPHPTHDKRHRSPLHR